MDILQLCDLLYALCRDPLWVSRRARQQARSLALDRVWICIFGRANPSNF